MFFPKNWYKVISKKTFKCIPQLSNKGYTYFKISSQHIMNIISLEKQILSSISDNKRKQLWMFDVKKKTLLVVIYWTNATGMTGHNIFKANNIQSLSRYYKNSSWMHINLPKTFCKLWKPVSFNKYTVH